MNNNIGNKPNKVDKQVEINNSIFAVEQDEQCAFNSIMFSKNKPRKYIDKATKIEKLKITFAVIVILLSLCSFQTSYKIKEHIICTDYKEFAISGSAVRYHFGSYMGRFNGYEIVYFGDNDPYRVCCFGTMTEYIDTDLYIVHFNERYLHAWKKGKFYTLKELYDTGELSRTDIIRIRNRFYMHKPKGWKGRWPLT